MKENEHVPSRAPYYAFCYKLYVKENVINCCYNLYNLVLRYKKNEKRNLGQVF